MTLNTYSNRFRSVKHSNRTMSKNDRVCGGKYLLKTSGNAISETLIFKMSPEASALKNLCLWCEFQSHRLFTISLLLKNFSDSPAYVWPNFSLESRWLCIAGLWSCNSVGQLYRTIDLAVPWLPWFVFRHSSRGDKNQKQLII